MVLLAMGGRLRAADLRARAVPARDPHHARQLRKNRRIGYFAVAVLAVALPGVDPVTTMIEIAAALGALRGLDLALGPLSNGAQPAASGAALLWRPMARAAVKAKQAQAGSRQAAPRRRRRRGAARAQAPCERRQPEPAALLHRGCGASAKSVYSSSPSSSPSPSPSSASAPARTAASTSSSATSTSSAAAATSVSKAQKEIQKHPNDPKGFRDLATAYESKGDTPTRSARSSST